MKSPYACYSHTNRLVLSSTYACREALECSRYEYVKEEATSVGKFCMCLIGGLPTYRVLLNRVFAFVQH